MKQVAFLFLLLPIKLFACQFAKTELERTFLKAAKEDNGELVKECLKNGVNPNVQDRISGHAALHCLLSLRGVDFAGATSYTFKCIPAKRLNALNFLFLHRHLDVNIRNTITGDTPLHIAARAPINIIETANRMPALLKNFRIPLNETFYFTTMPTEHFIADYSSIYVAALLSKGANPTLYNHFNKPPIHSATSLRTFKFLLEKTENRVDLQIIIRSTKLNRVELKDKNLTFLPEYNGLPYTINATNFNSEMAKLALYKMKKKYKKIDDELGYKNMSAIDDDINTILTPLCRSGRILRYYCTVFDMLKSPEPRDPEKQCFPIFPREIVHHYFAVPATQAYIEKIQEEEAAKKSDRSFTA